MRATWRVLPAFVARHLWRRWTAVARAIASDTRHSALAAIPANGFDSSRRELVELFTAGRVLGVHALVDIAAPLHAIEPGIRLM